MQTIIDKKNKFISKFDNQTGFYFRTGIINDKGIDTGVDPFMASFPQLLDVGVMGSCQHYKVCAMADTQCYQHRKGEHKSQPNMTLEQFKSIVDQCKGKTFQLALGGRGDVNKHEEFEDIFQYCRDNGIIPNYTTSGLGLTEKEVEVTKRLGGAVAVSWYRQNHTIRAIDMFVNAGVITNIHYILGNNSIDEAINRLVNNDFPKGIHAVIFLLHKPVGLGQQENVLQVSDPRVKKFYKLLDTHKLDFKVGFDTCNTTAIINFNEKVDENSIDSCESGRFSAYITPDMQMLPCSFDNEKLRWAVDLNKHSIQEAWNSDKFENFRNHFRFSCSGCDKRTSCFGGCPITRQIVLCNSIHKDLYEEVK